MQGIFPDAENVPAAHLAGGVLDGVGLDVSDFVLVVEEVGVDVLDGVGLDVNDCVLVVEGVCVGVIDEVGVVLKLLQEALRPVIAVITPLWSL